VVLEKKQTVEFDIDVNMNDLNLREEKKPNKTRSVGFASAAEVKPEPVEEVDPSANFKVPDSVLKEVQTMLELRDGESKAETTEHIANKEYSDVLLIVTGGTLCMTQTPNGFAPAKGLANRLKAYKTFYDREESEKLEVDEDTLVTPPTAYKTRIRFKVLEFEDLIDSSNISVDE